MANTPVTGKSSNKSRTISVKVNDRDMRALLATFGKMDDIAKNDMRKISEDLAERAGRFVSTWAYTSPNPAQADAVMKSLKINRKDKAPNFSIGGRATVTRSGAKAGLLIFGAEFGSNRLKQFPPRSSKSGRGNRGWWIFSALQKFQPVITEEWLKGYEKIVDVWKGRVG